MRMMRRFKLGALALLAFLAFGIAGLLILGAVLIVYQIYTGRLVFELDEGGEGDSYLWEESYEADAGYEASDNGSSDASSE